MTVNDFFIENATAYIVMEYIDGQTLKSYLAQMGGRLSAAQVFDMMRPVMTSLAEVHKSGMIHRDISPDNIMISREGYVKLLDFGAAREFADSGSKSLSIMLKPGFAPEEQYRSKGKQGPWTDVYALSATMYKCITGVTPDESLERTQQDTLKPPSQMGISLPIGQEAALMKGLAVFQRDRFQTVMELYDALYGPQTGVSATAPMSVAELPGRVPSIKRANPVPELPPDAGSARVAPKASPFMAWMRKNKRKMIAATGAFVMIALIVCVQVFPVVIGGRIVYVSKIRTSLSLSRENISDISALAGHENLTSLNLDNNNISNISALAELTNLKSLSLSSNNISDISALARLTNLTDLFLAHSNISDISVLAKLTNLEYISLHTNNISDISALAGLTNLESLSLGSNNISDISSLAGLTNLKKLSLYSNPLTQKQVDDLQKALPNCEITASDLTGVESTQQSALTSESSPMDSSKAETTDVVAWKDAEFEKMVRQAMDRPEGDILKSELEDIEILWVSSGSSSSITSVSFVQHDPNKREGRITSLEDLVHFTGLKRFAIHDQPFLTDIFPLAEMTWLEWVDIRDTSVSDISPLAGLKNLTTLELLRNQIKDISHILALSKLEKLNLYGNQIGNNIPALSGLSSLTDLTLGNNQISDISPLADLTHLERLTITDNQIRDISPLAGLTDLTWLSIFRNQISDISPLANLRNLRTLYIKEGNSITDYSPVSHINYVG